MHLPKDIFENYNMNGMDFYDQPINCDKNWYEEIKLTTEQNEDYTTGLSVRLWIHQKSL